MTHSLSRLALSSLFLAAILLAGCSQPYVAWTDSSEPPEEAERITTCGSHPSTDTDAGGSEFSKPETTRQHERRFQRPPRSTNDSAIFTQSKMWPRPYEPTPDDKSVVWLNHGEHFAVDGSFEVGGRRYTDGRSQLRIIVLVDFRPVPFHLEHVTEPGGWTSRETFAELDFQRSQTLTLEHPAPANFSLVVPPESLGEHGLHDLRIVPLTDQGAPLERELFATFVTGFTLYYGSTQANRAEKPTFKTVARTRLSKPFRRYSSSKSGVLLYPRDQRRVMAESMDWSTFGLSDMQTTNASKLTLEATAIASTGEGVAQQNAYVVLDGTKPLDATIRRGETRPLTSYPEAPDTPYANRFQFDVPLDDDQLHVLRVLALPQPFCNWAKVDKDDPFGRISNPILVQRR